MACTLRAVEEGARACGGLMLHVPCLAMHAERRKPYSSLQAHTGTLARAFCMCMCSACACACACAHPAAATVRRTARRNAREPLCSLVILLLLCACLAWGIAARTAFRSEVESLECRVRGVKRHLHTTDYDVVSPVQPTVLYSTKELQVAECLRIENSPFERNENIAPR